jgi:hypothetical protein
MPELHSKKTKLAIMTDARDVTKRKQVTLASLEEKTCEKMHAMPLTKSLENLRNPVVWEACPAQEWELLVKKEKLKVVSSSVEVAEVVCLLTQEETPKEKVEKVLTLIPLL